MCPAFMRVLGRSASAVVIRDVCLVAVARGCSPRVASRLAGCLRLQVRTGSTRHNTPQAHGIERVADCISIRVDAPVRVCDFHGACNPGPRIRPCLLFHVSGIRCGGWSIAGRYPRLLPQGGCGSDQHTQICAGVQVWAPAMPRSEASETMREKADIWARLRGVGVFVRDTSRDPCVFGFGPCVFELCIYRGVSTQTWASSCQESWQTRKLSRESLQTPSP